MSEDKPKNQGNGGCGALFLRFVFALCFCALFLRFVFALCFLIGLAIATDTKNRACALWLRKYRIWQVYDQITLQNLSLV
jgi:hypothetical protein